MGQPVDDFFGGGLLGFDPFAEIKDRIAAQTQSAAGDTSSTKPVDTPTVIPNVSAAASNAITSGGNTFYNMPGFEESKMNDPNKFDPKYVFGRLAQQYDTKTQAGRDSLLAALKADPHGWFKNATLNNDILDVGENADPMFDGYRQFDIFSGSKAGDWNPWWNPIVPGGSSTAKATGAPSGGGMPLWPGGPLGQTYTGLGGYSLPWGLAMSMDGPGNEPPFNENAPLNGSMPVYPVSGYGNMGSIPADLVPLRGMLSSWLLQNFNKMPSPYPGQLTTGMNPWVGQGVDAIQNMMFPQLLQANNVALGASGTPNLQGMDWLNNAKSGMASMFASGGAPDITKALEDIRTRGMMDIEDAKAQTQAEYGTMGLSRGSDVAGSVARGASRGIADINAQQSSLAAQIMNSSADRRLQALSLAPQFASAAANPYDQMFARQLQAAGIVGNNASAFGTGANSIMQAGQFGTALDQSNLQNIYNEWVRQQTPPYLNAAISYASGYTPNPPPIQQSGSGFWGAMGSILPYLLMMGLK